MEGHSGGFLDQGLLAQPRDTIEDQAWSALVAHEKCCLLEADLTAVVTHERREGCERLMLTRGVFIRPEHRRVPISVWTTRGLVVVFWLLVISMFAGLIAVTLANAGAGAAHLAAGGGVALA